MDRRQQNRPRSTPRQPTASFHIEGVSVDVVAARAGVTVRRVQYLEREGLVSPADRSNRLYDENAIERVQLIERLIVDLGVNLPGAAVILHMRERMLSLIEELDQTRSR